MGCTLFISMDLYSRVCQSNTTHVLTVLKGGAWAKARILQLINKSDNQDDKHHKKHNEQHQADNSQHPTTNMVLRTEVQETTITQSGGDGLYPALTASTTTTLTRSYTTTNSQSSLYPSLAEFDNIPPFVYYPNPLNANAPFPPVSSHNISPPVPPNHNHSLLPYTGLQSAPMATANQITHQHSTNSPHQATQTTHVHRTVTDSKTVFVSGESVGYPYLC